MIVVGLVGGIASGKSAVAEVLRRLGAAVISADQIGHNVLALPQTIQALRERWGERILGKNGQVDRGAVARIVFAPPPEGPIELKFLESVTHPEIGRRIQSRLSELRQAGTSVAVLDAAVLLETGWRDFCQRIVFVDVDRAERLHRAQSRGWDKDQFAEREARQLPVDEKKRRADTVIDNSSSLDHTAAQVQRFWESLDVRKKP